jgi:hypothetical protein
MYAIFRREQTSFTQANASGETLYETEADAIQALVETEKLLPAFMHGQLRVHEVVGEIIDEPFKQNF